MKAAIARHKKIPAETMHQNSRGGIVYTAMMFMDIAASEILMHRTRICNAGNAREPTSRLLLDA